MGKDKAKMTEKEPMTAEEKKRNLYLRQKDLLDTFLEHGTISHAQYDKSLGDLTEKMGVKPDGRTKGLNKRQGMARGMLQPPGLQRDLHLYN